MHDIPISIPIEDIKNLKRKTQIDIMRGWFYERFEDPAERTPYETAEGGYLWIWGGPYDAREQLESQFSNYVSEDIIDELIEELQGECWEWAPTDRAEDYEDHLIDDIVEIENCHEEFETAMADILYLLEIKIPDTVIRKMYSLLFTNVITALEAYLSDKFIKRVMSDDETLRRCVESSPEFSKQKVPISEVLKIADSIKSRTKKYLAAIVWHNLERIKPMYESVLQVDLGDISPIMNAVNKRHDLVHRNGRDNEGNPVNVSIEDIQELVSHAKTLVDKVESKLGSVESEFKDCPF